GLRGAGEAAAGGDEAPDPDSDGMPLEGDELLPGLRVPHLLLPGLTRAADIPRRAGQALAVRAEADAGDTEGVSLEGELLLPRLGVPHLHRPVVGGGGQAPAARAAARAHDVG